MTLQPLFLVISIPQARERDLSFALLITRFTIIYRQVLNELLVECRRHGMFVDVAARNTLAPLGATSNMSLLMELGR